MDVFRKMMRFTSFITFPLMFGFGLVAKEFIVIAIGEKWLASAELIQILCVSGAIMPLATLFSNMIISKGRSGTFFWCTFSLGLVQIITMLLIWQWGIRSMVIAYLLLNTSWLLVWLFFVRRLTGYGYWRFFLRCNAICTCSCWCYGCKLCRYAIAQQPLGIADITLCYCSHIILYSDEGCKSKDIKGV